MQETVNLGVTPAYLRGRWGIREALREIYANALDADGQAGTTVTVQPPWIRFTNVSPIAPAHLFFGGGTEKGGEAIGQFREGLKMAALALVAEGRQVWVETAGWKGIFGLESRFGAQTLKVDLEPWEADGTTVCVEATAEEWAQAQAYFAHYGETQSRYFFESPPRIYVNGVAVAPSPFALSYSLIGEEAKALQNRDRDILDAASLRKVCERVWETLPFADVDSVTRRIVRDWIIAFTPSQREAISELRWFPNTPADWGRWLRRKIGKVALVDPYDGTPDDQVQLVRGWGYHVVSVTPLIKQLLRGAPTVSDVFSRRVRRNLSKGRGIRSLTAAEQAIFHRARALAEEAVGIPLAGWQWLFVEAGEKSILGETAADTKKIAVQRELLRTPARLVTVLIHEMIHANGVMIHYERFIEATEEAYARLLAQQGVVAATASQEWAADTQS